MCTRSISRVKRRTVAKSSAAAGRLFQLLTLSRFMVKLTSMFTIRSVHRSINFLSSYSSCISLYVMHVLAF